MNLSSSTGPLRWVFCLAGKPSDVRPKITLIAVGVVVALVVLYFAHIFYIQSLIVVWGVAIMLGSYVYDKAAREKREAGREARRSEREARLQQDLAEVERKMAGEKDQAKTRELRTAEARLERDLRNLRWAEKERAAERLRAATSGESLSPLPPRAGFWQRQRQAKRETGHLRMALDEAIGVLSSEPPASAKARIALIASDLKAHYGAIRGSKEGGNVAGDYADAWTVLYSISKGSGVGRDVFRHSPRMAKSKLNEILDLAELRGALEVSASGG